MKSLIVFAVPVAKYYDKDDPDSNIRDYTRSGKPIYSFFHPAYSEGGVHFPEHYPDWTPQDHHDAANSHRKQWVTDDTAEDAKHRAVQLHERAATAAYTRRRD